VDEQRDYFVKKYPLSTAEKDGTLNLTASTYSSENDALTPGISRDGVRLITFAPILKNRNFPLTESLELLLDMGRWGMGTPVEIEFAVNLNVPRNEPVEFGLLQMRPMVSHPDLEVYTIQRVEPDRLICQSDQVLGNGLIKNISDIVLVDRERFDRSKSREVAAEVGYFNSRLIAGRRPYLLVGVGRWGTLDPWLGIPVAWDQISGARAIIEADFKDFSVMPSQGTHFFQNLNTFLIGYFTVRSEYEGSFIDWDWLKRQPPVKSLTYTRHLSFQNPIHIKMDGRQHKGIIMKPEA